MENVSTMRVLIAKPGLDGHDLGAKIVGLALRDAGMEVVYTGLHRTVEEIVSAALQEDVDVIGLSILSGAHMSITGKLMAELARQGLSGVPVVVGGVIPEQDVEPMKMRGVQRVFAAGESSLDDIVAGIRALAGKKAISGE